LSVSLHTSGVRPRSTVIGVSWRFHCGKKWNNYFRMIQSGSRDWRPLYQAALLETEVAKLPEQITARGTIFDRIEESLKHSLPGEHGAMDDALRNLRTLRR